MAKNDVDSNSMRINKIFQELKDSGQIKKERILNINFSTYFFASYPPNTINYNPVCPLPENDFIPKFVLLHEEGHLNQSSKRIKNRHRLLILSTLVFLAFFYYFNLIFIILYLPFLAIVFRFFGSYIHEDEFNADLYSANSLKKHFKRNDTAEIAQKTFEYFRNQEQCMRGATGKGIISLKDRIIMNFVVLIQDALYIYPSTHERIERIKREIDNNPNR